MLDLEPGYGEDDRFALVSDVFQHLQPVHIAGADLVRRHVRVEVVHGFEVVGRGEIIDAHFVTFRFEHRCPIQRNGSVGIDLKNALLPAGLVRDLALHGFEAVIGDDLGSAEVLELGSIRPGFLGQVNEHQCPFQLAIVIGGNISNKVGGVLRTDQVIANCYFHFTTPFRMDQTRVWMNCGYPRRYWSYSFCSPVSKAGR